MTAHGEPSGTQIRRRSRACARSRLLKILDIVRAPERLSSNDLRCYRTIFLQMVNWLPKDEAAQFLREFDTEVKRLEAP